VRILSRYFLVSYLTLFAVILLTSLLAITVIEVLLHFDHVLEHRGGFAGVATYVLVRVPAYYLRELIPVSSFAAAFLCLGISARGREVMALKAGGISPHCVIVPLLVASALLSAGTLLVNESAVLGATRAFSHLERDNDEITFRRGSFWYHRGDAIYNVREADRESRTLSGVHVYELSPEGRLVRSITADSVEVQDGRRWRLLDATFRTFDPESPSAPPRVEHSEESILVVAERRNAALLDADASQLSLLDLREYIRARVREGRDVERYRSMFHLRVSDPLAVVLFALLAIPIGLGVERTRSLSGQALLGVAIVAVFYALRTAGAAIGAGGAVPAALPPWLLLAAFGGVGVWRLATIPR
jgi:lipopolysaccharide export system permease protein